MKFKEMAPLWWQAIKLFRQWNKQGPIEQTEYYKFVEKHKLDMGTFKKCLVGEAHGFTDDYFISWTESEEMESKCKYCTDMAVGFAIAMYSPDSFDEFMKEFEKHMCEIHPNSTLNVTQ